MALPTSRDITLAPGSQFPSALGNKLQDQIIGSKRPASFRSIHHWSVVGPAGTSWSFGGIDYVVSTGGSALEAMIKVPFEVGDRITGVTFRGYGDGSVDCVHTLTWYSNTMVATDIGTITDNNRAAAYGDVAIPGTTPHTMAAGETLLWRLVVSAANYRIGNPLVSFDRL